MGAFGSFFASFRELGDTFQPITNNFGESDAGTQSRNKNADD